MKNILCMKRFQVACASAAWSFCFSPVAAQAGDIHTLVRDKAGKEVADAVVVALPAYKTAKSASSANVATVIVDQVKKEFIPYVLPIQIGTAVNFPNKDNIRHHVYSFSPAKTFELPLYTGTPAAPVVFDKAGPVVLGCNIHDWMISYIYVSESPYFAKTGADGKAALIDLPPGKYTVRASLVGYEPSTAEVFIQSAADTVVYNLGLSKGSSVPVARSKQRYGAPRVPSDVVRGLYQDAEGYVWLATDRGVARFDGGNFESSSMPGSWLAPLEGEDVLCMAEVGGAVWFGTANGWLRMSVELRSDARGQEVTPELITDAGTVTVTAQTQDEIGTELLGLIAGLIKERDV